MTGPAPFSRVEEPIAARRGGVRSSWWGKAWQAAVEEACYSTTDLKQGQRWARVGKVGHIEWGIAEGSGYFLAGVEQGDDVYSARATVACLPPDQAAALGEVVAAEAGRIGALLLGDLPRSVVADAEEVGVELLPWSGELTFACSCEPWADPCPHAVALATQVGWLMDADVDVLLTLRGVPLEVLTRAHNERSRPVDNGAAAPSEWLADLAVAVEAAQRAADLLSEPAVDESED